MEKVKTVSIEDGVVGVIGDSEIALVTPQGEVTIPILEVTWADERQWCGIVHDYLSDGAVPDGDCPMHRDGLCRLTANMPCLFDEPETSPGWQKAREWKRCTTPKGEYVLVRRQDIEGCEELAVGGFLVGADVQLPIAVTTEAAQV